MKKILFIFFTVFLSVSSLEIEAQTIDSISLTQPILCSGDFATATAYVNQTAPPTPLSYVLQLQNQFGFWVQLGFSAQGTGVTSPFPGLLPGTYRILIVDSVLYESTPIPGQNPGSIFDSEIFNIAGVAQLTSSTTSVTDNSCAGDCNAEERINISGGTPPYSIIYNGVSYSLGINSSDTILSGLCSGNYNVEVKDVNNCSTSPMLTAFTIAPIAPLVVELDSNPQWNGQVISCSGPPAAADGEIIANVISGGTPPYSYSLGGGPFQSSGVFSGLIAGTYTVTFRDANLCETTDQITILNPPGFAGLLSIDQQVSCNGSCDGIITVVVDNVFTGTPPYQYSKDGGLTFQPTPSFSNLCGDTTYFIKVADANGCFFDANITLVEPTAISFTATPSNYNSFGVSCFGLNDGQITISNVTGGNPPYTYSIDGGVNFSNTMTYTGLFSGLYTVVVKDDNDCIDSTTIILTEPGQFILTGGAMPNPAWNGYHVSCYGECDGQAQVISTNGVGLITYTLNGVSQGSLTTYVNLCGNQTSPSGYTVIATDANGCSSNSVNIVLNEPDSFIYSMSSIQETCNQDNGEASINVTQGGVTPYAYLWDDDPVLPQVTSTATGLNTGTYTVIVTDANGCSFSDNVFVDEADITLSFSNTPPCNNLNDGSATVSPIGTPPYNILWETGETTNTINGLAPGWYEVTVTDATGCSVTDSVEIPPSAIVDLLLDPVNSVLHVECLGDQSDSIVVIASGGTGINTYLYFIPNVFPVPQTSNVFYGLLAGTYTIFVQDFNGCTDSIIVTITQPNQLIFSADGTNLICFKDSSGTAFINNISGGTPPYSYTWENANNPGITIGTTDSIFNLLAGDYVLWVTDSLGCDSNPDQDTVKINQPDSLYSSINIISHARCAGVQIYAEGEMGASGSGGTPNYSFSWNTIPLQNSPSINMLMPGWYTVTITDLNGCTTIDSAEIFEGINPELNTVVQNVSCFGLNDGIIYTSAISGTPPYLFSFDGGNSFVPPGTPYGPSGPMATVIITVYDSLGCLDTDSTYIEEPDLLEITNIFSENISCYDSADGEIAVHHVGGTAPFSYQWSDGQVDSIAINLDTGTYRVFVVDTNGCTDSSSHITITQPDSLYILSLTSTPVFCYGDSNGTVSVIGSGGTPIYSYEWSYTGGGLISNTTSNPDSLIAGNYSVNVLDVNGCISSGNITINTPAPLSVTYIKDSVQCLGGADGWATALVSGGNPSYTYIWDNGDITSTADSLDAGYHTVTITDSKGCILIDSVEILEPLYSIMIDSLIISPMTCYGSNNASITVLATGGYQPYLYSNTGGLNMQSNIGFWNLAGDQYTMYVEDSKGCSDTAIANIMNPDSLYIDTTIFVNVSCYDSCNAYIDNIVGQGGTGPYTYSVNGYGPHNGFAYFTDYCPGIYTVEIFDANNCVAQDIIIIEEPPQLNVSITTPLWNNYQIRCNGEDSGIAIIQVSGGEPPYIKTVVDAINPVDTIGYNSNFTYDASTGEYFINHLPEGTHLFLIQDANGCVYSEIIDYEEPDPITHNFIATHIMCEGWSNGSLTDVVSGGVGNATTYTYLWNTGATTYSLNNIPAGNYTITVTDENGCESIDSYVINDNNVLNVSINSASVADVSCHNYCDGTIGVNVSGGIPNIDASGNPVYAYLWDDILAQNTETAIGLCVNNSTNQTTYTCVAIDAQGCTDTIEYILTQPEELIVNASIVNEVNCNGGDNGELIASTTGGTPISGSSPYNYVWNNAITTAINSTLSTGSYVVVVEDANNCLDTTEIYLPEPSQHYIDTIRKSDVSCWGESTGEITIGADSGTVIGIQQYRYEWSNGIIETIDISTITNLDTGVYYVDIFDAHNCKITSQAIWIEQPANPLTIRVDSTDETCTIDDGTATAYMHGGVPPYTYSWSNGDNGLGMNVIEDLPPGTYSVIVTDANGCLTIDAHSYHLLDGATYVNGVRNIFLPGNVDAIDTSLCLGHKLELEIEKKNGLSYDWSVDGDVTLVIDYSLNPNIPDIIATPNSEGIHILTLEITDPSCSQSYNVEVTIIVSQLDPMLNTDPEWDYSDENIPNKKVVTQIFGEEVELVSENLSCDDYQWTWDTDTSNSRKFDDTPDNSTWYYLEVHANGCKGYDSVFVVVGVIPYDGFSPNGDQFNEEWIIEDIYSYPDAQIQIFNRWGVLIYDKTGAQYLSDPWDGTHNGKEASIGTYYYIISLNNGDEPQTGTVTIVR